MKENLLLDTKKIRKMVFYTQKKFADELNVSIGTVRGWEQGLFKPNITQQGKLFAFCEKHNILKEN